MKTGGKKRRIVRGLVIFGAALPVLLLGGLLFLGFFFAGPFRDLAILRITAKYRGRPAGEILFYGASNFALWTTLEADMKPYAVQNHGFGGSTDQDLMDYAGKLLYPYEPGIVFFQTGSNDLVTGLRLDQITANKDRMYGMFRRALPRTVFVVMSSLPLPGRREYWADSERTNRYLRDYCAAHDNMVFVDATPLMMTGDGGFRPELYRSDGIHLNREGQKIWGALILEVLEKL
jgi:lysophospholipase L1-like esterase